MSSILNHKKKVLKSKGYKEIKDYAERRKITQNAESCFNNIFSSFQLCAWYVLYAPEFFDWNYVKLKDFSDRMNENNCKFGEYTKKYQDAEERLAEEIGINVKAESKKYPFRAKLAMGGVKVKQSELSLVLNSMNIAVECGLFLVLYTIYRDFGMSKDDIHLKFMPQFNMISGEFSNGLTRKTLIQYFEELEGWNIEVEEGAMRAW